MSAAQWVVFGSGYIAREWILAIQSCNHGDICVIARNPQAMNAITAEFPAINAYHIGSEIAETAVASSDFIIVCTSIISTLDIARHALELRKRDAVIILEKPGFDFSTCISNFFLEPVFTEPGIHIAYNRRFYDGTGRFSSNFQRMYKSSGEVNVKIGVSENFLTIDTEKFPESVVSNWVAANTIHIIDLVTFVMETADIDILGDLHPYEIMWDRDNTFRIQAPCAVINLTVEAHSDRPGWYFEAENKIEQISLRPLEKFSHRAESGVRTQVEADFPKPGYKNMVKKLILGDLGAFPSFKKNIEFLVRMQGIFKQPD